MAHQINTMYAATFYISSSQTLYMTNDLTGSATAVTFPAGYYTPYLANTGSADGTQQAPWCFIQKTREKVGSYFNFTLESDGKVKIAYRGVGTGMISFVSSSLLKNILGFITTSASFTSGSSVTATYQPFGAVFAINSTQTDDWQTQLSQQAYEELPNGIVYGFKDDIFKHTRKQTLRFFPKNQTFKDSLAVYPSTPIFPVSKSQWQQPTIDPVSYSPPFTFLQFLRMSTGKPVQVVHGTFQANISGTNLEYDSAYLRPGYFGIEGFQKVSIPNYDALRDAPEIELILSSSNSRQIWDAPSLSSFTPSSITNLYAWYKYDNLSLNGTTVSAALDKSGNGRHAVQATSASQPTYSATGGANNLPYWTGTDAVSGGRYLLGGVAADWTFLHDGSGHTVFIISKTASTQQNYIFGTQTGTGASLGSSIVRINNTTANWTIGNAAISIISQNFAWTQTSWGKLAFSGSTGGNPDYSVRVNGVDVVSVNESAVPAATTSTQKLGIGSGGGGAYSSAVSFHEVIIYNRELTSSEVSQVESYLSSSYGV